MLNLKNSNFSSDIKIRSDGGSDAINISDSGIIKVTDNNSIKTHNTDISPFSSKISSKEIFITPLGWPIKT